MRRERRKEPLPFFSNLHHKNRRAQSAVRGAGFHSNVNLISARSRPRSSKQIVDRESKRKSFINTSLSNQMSYLKKVVSNRQKIITGNED